jgi:L-alanine-DL-glutamate epimerase-like enolase superfamily enzyme
MSAAWDHLADLPLKVESYELTDHDREYGDFTRPSTVVHLRGDGQEGIGEDVVYDVLDHIAHRDAGPVLAGDLTAPQTLGQACDLLGELDLFAGAPPEREPSRHYRRWAYESAALDLALRQTGLALWEVVERDPKPLRFVCSTRLTTFGEDERKSTTAPMRKRLERYPTLEFKLDPENDWDEALIDEIASLAPVHILDLKGLYRGTPVDVETDPQLYRAVAEKFPAAWLEDPDLEPVDAREALEPHADRVTWDAPLHTLADVKDMARKAINSKPSRFGSLQDLLEIYEYCDSNGIAVYGGGQGEQQCGRGQIQYLASLFHHDTPNDVAPSGYNDPAVPTGMPSSPMDPVPSGTGFRWAEAK